MSFSISYHTHTSCPSKTFLGISINKVILLYLSFFFVAKVTTRASHPDFSFSVFLFQKIYLLINIPINFFRNFQLIFSLNLSWSHARRNCLFNFPFLIYLKANDFLTLKILVEMYERTPEKNDDLEIIGKILKNYAI